MESEQAAAHCSVWDVLEGFGALFGRPPFMPSSPPPAAAAGGEAEAASGGGDGAAPGATSSKQGSKDAAPAPAPAPASFWRLLADVRRRVSLGQLLGGQPLQAMRALLAAVQPRHLQADIEQQLPPEQAAAASTAASAAAIAAAMAAAATAGTSSAGASAAGGTADSALAEAVRMGDHRAIAAHLQAAVVLPGSMPSFPLCTPKVAALAGDLMQYQGAAAASAAAASQQGGRPGGAGGWCGIVFVTQRMTAWALHKLLRWAC